MSNMSYCRFENTFRALRDCKNALNDGEEFSSTERQYAKKLIHLCKRIAEENDAEIGDEEYQSN